MWIRLWAVLATRPSGLSPSQQFAAFSLAVLLLLGAGLGLVLGAAIEDEITRGAATLVASSVSGAIHQQVTSADLDGAMTGQRLLDFDAFVRANVLSSQVARVKLWSRSGEIVYADDDALIGQAFPVADELAEALETGRVVAELSGAAKDENRDERGFGRLIEVYTPLVPRDAVGVAGVFEVYMYDAPIAAGVARAQRTIWLSIAVAIALLWAALAWVFRGASRNVRRARQAALHDPLTGLANRVLFRDRLDQALLSTGRDGELALMVLDLDRFKDVNDALGHEAGDAVLREVAERLGRCVRGSDTVARLGGDEFALLLPSAGAGARRVAQAITNALAAPVDLDGRSLVVGASLGIAVSAPEDRDAEQLLRLADHAMYAAKRAHEPYRFRQEGEALQRPLTY